MGERTHKRRHSPVYPSVPLLCFPTSQSIFMLSQCSPDDLQRRSLLIPSALSLWTHYKPHIYLIWACCLPAWMAAGHSVCVTEREPISMCVLYSWVCTWRGREYYLTWDSIWGSIKCHVKWRAQCPGVRGGLWDSTHFFLSFTCTLPSSDTQKKKHTSVQSWEKVSVQRKVYVPIYGSLFLCEY